MPTQRASGYFLASLLAAYGLGFGGLIALDTLPMWAIVFAAWSGLALLVGFVVMMVTLARTLFQPR